MELLTDAFWQRSILYQFNLLKQRSRAEPPLSETPGTKQKLSAPEASLHHQAKLTSGGVPSQLSISFGKRKFSTWLSPKSMFSYRLPL